MPPLRERKEDIPLLAEHLVQKHASKMGKNVSSISARTLRYLRSQSWPGNVRELEGAVLRALITTTGPILDYSEGGAQPQAATVALPSASAASLQDAQRDHILDILHQTEWVIEGKKGAASVLGLAASSLRSKMKRLGIERP